MIDLVPPFQGLNSRIKAQLLTAQATPNDGEWVDFAHISIWSIHVTDISGGDVVQIRVSNALTKPADSVDGVRFGRNIVAERSVSSAQHRFRWVKVKKEAGSSSSPNAYLFADWRVIDR